MATRESQRVEDESLHPFYMICLGSGTLARATGHGSTPMGERMHHWRRTLTGAALLLLLVGTSASAGVTVQAECEDYVDSYNIGGGPIMKSFCSGASEFHAADGLDITGEWIEVEIAVPLTGYYQPLLGYQTAYEDSSGVRLTVVDDEVAEVNRIADFDLLDGWGFG